MWRAHDDHELAWAASGTCVIEANGDRYPLDDLWALWVPAGVRHRVEPGSDSLVLPVWFDGAEHASWTDRVTPVLRGAALDRLVRTVLQHGLTSPEEQATAIARLHTLVGTALRDGGPTPLPASTPARRVALALLSDPRRPDTLEDWAKKVHTSGKPRQRAFTDDLGMPFRRWRTRVRVAAAVSRLRAGETVESTSTAVGFRSPSAFAAACRSELAMTPGQVRHADSIPPFTD